MKVRCRYPGAWNSYSGARPEEVELEEGATVGHLLELLGARSEDSLRSLLVDSRGRRKILISLGGNLVDEGRPLSDGDTVTFILPISGGQFSLATARALALAFDCASDDY